MNTKQTDLAGRTLNPEDLPNPGVPFGRDTALVPNSSPMVGSGELMSRPRHSPSVGISRRTAIGRLVIGGAAALVAGDSVTALAQEGTPGAGTCVATAPPAEDGIGFASLLVGGVIHDMPSGPVEVRISRFTLAPDTIFEAAALPYPALMYIETGESACPGEAGRIVYNPDGSVLDEATENGVQYIPTGTTQYIPAGIADGAGNEGTGLMSSIVIEFVPVETDSTPTA